MGIYLVRYYDPELLWTMVDVDDETLEILIRSHIVSAMYMVELAR